MGYTNNINWLKKANRLDMLDRETADTAGGPEREASNEQLSEGMQAALMTISPDYRAVVVLKHLLGCSYQEISDVLEIPEKTVKSRLYTARQLLQRTLTERGLHT